MNEKCNGRNVQMIISGQDSKKLNRILRIITRYFVAAILLFSWLQPRQTSSAAFVLGGKAETKAAMPIKLPGLPSEKMQKVIVTLKRADDLQQPVVLAQGASRQERVIRSLHAQAEASQKRIKTFLEDSRIAGKTGKIAYLWVVNGFSLEATPEIIQALADRPGVEHIVLNEIIPAPAPQVVSGTAWDNLGRINAPLVWAAGFYGQGVVVANMDTGVDYTHPELSAQYRGGTNSWYDPADAPGSHPTPVDLPSKCGSISGHGTGTMSVMVGKNLGVAPEAKWIAVKIFDDNCTATVENILAGFQWLMDPDGDPATADAPQVVNNSWGAAGCDTSMVFQTALQNLRDAGILPVFSAGNSGPYSYSSTFPANYPEAFAVGATDNMDWIAYYSSRGPNNCISPSVDSIYPAIVAPGTNIRVAYPGGGYGINSGTSFAAPHVAGALALLLSAFPNEATLLWQETVLKTTAFDLGSIGQDNIYGYGRLDVWAAYQAFQNQVTLTTGALQVIEDAQVIPITLSITQSPSLPVTIKFSTAGGKASANGIDYTLPSSVTFTPCNPCSSDDLVKVTYIDIVEDTLPEADETFQLMLMPINVILSNSGPLINGTILDNDPTVGFSLPDQRVDQKAGSANVSITRTGGLSMPFSVDCAIVDGSANLGVNNRLSPADLHFDFASGESQKDFSISIVDDKMPGPNWSINLLLKNPYGVMLSPDSSQMVLTVLNNNPWLRVYLPSILH